MLKLDTSLTQAISVENYKIRNSRSDFQPVLMYLSRVSFLITLNIYKDYFKRPSRMHCVTRDKNCPSSSFFLKNLLLLYAKAFVTKELPDFHY